MNKKINTIRRYVALSFIGLILLLLGACSFDVPESAHNSTIEVSDASNLDAAKPDETLGTSLDLENLPVYDGNPYVEIDGNIPSFSDSDKARTDAFEEYSDLDDLGRCGVAYANVCTELMPTEPRGEIGMIRPSGWHTVKYNELIEDNYLYNRCHLIGYQLAGENSNEKNLITGTRYLNVEGMLPFEDEVASYVESTGNHVLYRVTPIFVDENLVASGVQMEAWSVEDEGDGICFNVYCFNVQPYIFIDYATGDSYALENATESITTSENDATSAESNATIENQSESGTDAVHNSDDEVTCDYVLNSNTHKIHLPTCSSVSDMKEKNKVYYSGDIEDLINQGYSRCQRCLGTQ